MVSVVNKVNCRPFSSVTTRPPVASFGGQIIILIICAKCFSMFDVTVKPYRWQWNRRKPSFSYHAPSLIRIQSQGWDGVIYSGLKPPEQERKGISMLIFWLGILFIRGPEMCRDDCFGKWPSIGSPNYSGSGTWDGTAGKFKNNIAGISFFHKQIVYKKGDL